MKNAPHLPAKTCRVDTYYRLQNVKWILLFALFAFIAGGSAALIFSAWVVPSGDFLQVWSGGPGGLERGPKNQQPDPILERQARQRIFSIHDKRKKAGSEFYSQESFLALAAALSSDGWLAARQPGYLSGVEKNWEIIDSQGASYRLEKTVYDKMLGLVYLKIQAEGLRVVSFPAWSEVAAGANVWIINFSGWKSNALKEMSKASEKNLFAVWQPQYLWQLWDQAEPGSLVLNEKGEFLGMAGEQSRVAPGWLIQKQTSALLSGGKLSYLGLPWQGYFVRGGGEDRNIFGFYVEKTGGNFSVLRGDVVIKINGQDVQEEKLAETIWLAPDEFQVTVWRAGEEAEVVVKKISVSP